jgi:hypothetical protein
VQGVCLTIRCLNGTDVSSTATLCHMSTSLWYLLGRLMHAQFCVSFGFVRAAGVTPAQEVPYILAVCILHSTVICMAGD